MSWHALNTFLLRLLLWGANLFFVISFILLTKNYFQINDIDYLSTSRSYRITILVYLFLLIFFGGLCCRKTELPLNIYRIYLGLLVGAIILSTVFFVFNLDRTINVTSKILEDVKNYSQDKNVPRLDQFQKKFKCCGIDNSLRHGYSKAIPDSCINKKLSKSIIVNTLIEMANLRTELNNRVNDNSTENEFLNNNKNYLEDSIDELPKTYFEDNCLDILTNLHKDQSELTGKLLITTIFSSLGAGIIIYILMFVKEEDF